MNQSKLEVITGSWRKARENAWEKTRASESRLVLVLLLIGWKISSIFLSQSCSVANAKPITFRHSNENRSILDNKYLGTSFTQSSDRWPCSFANWSISDACRQKNPLIWVNLSGALFSLRNPAEVWQHFCSGRISGMAILNPPHGSDCCTRKIPKI